MATFTKGFSKPVNSLNGNRIPSMDGEVKCVGFDITRNFNGVADKIAADEAESIRETAPAKGTRKAEDRGVRRRKTKNHDKRMERVYPYATDSIRKNRNGAVIHKGNTFSWHEAYKKYERRLRRHYGKEICRATDEYSPVDSREIDLPATEDLGGHYDNERQVFVPDFIKWFAESKKLCWDYRSAVSWGDKAEADAIMYCARKQYCEEYGLEYDEVFPEEAKPAQKAKPVEEAKVPDNDHYLISWDEGIWDSARDGELVVIGRENAMAEFNRIASGRCVDDQGEAALYKAKVNERGVVVADYDQEIMHKIYENGAWIDYNEEEEDE